MELVQDALFHLRVHSSFPTRSQPAEAEDAGQESDSHEPHDESDEEYLYDA